jgi:hypothetical protein
MLPLDDDQQLLLANVRQFTEEYIAPRALQRDANEEFPDDELRQGAKIGLLGIAIPEEYGGLPLDSVLTALIYAEISRVSPAISLILSVHNSLTSAAIAGHAQSALKKRLLPLLAGGDALGAYCLTEPQAGSDAAAIQTRAERIDGGYRLSGEKIFITNGGQAGVFVVFAVTDHSARTSKRITAFVVERDTPGLRTGPKERKLGLNASHTHAVSFDDCLVPEENVLGSVGDGFPIAMQLLEAGRIGIAAQAVGIAQGALDVSLTHALARKQFGQRIAEFQAIQWKLADMATELSGARLLMWNAARLKDAGEDFALAASQAKLFASGVAVRAANEAVQIHGGSGYMRDVGVERLYRDAKVTEIYEGTSEIQRMVIARHLLRAAEDAAGAA